MQYGLVPKVGLGAALFAILCGRWVHRGEGAEAVWGEEEAGRRRRGVEGSFQHPKHEKGHHSHPMCYSCKSISHIII